MILVVGAGSLGSSFAKEIRLKYPNIQISIVDMDIVEQGNVGRHEYIEEGDVGKYKAEIVGKEIKAEYHCGRVEELPMEYFKQFRTIVCAVDSLVTRRWLNWVLYQIVGSSNESSERDILASKVAQPEELTLVEMGCEGKMGHLRIMQIAKGNRGPCIECTKSLYHSPEHLPLCTIPSKMDLNQCVQWANATSESFSLAEIEQNAKLKASSQNLDPALITREFCELVLNHTIPTDIETNRLIAKLSIRLVEFDQPSQPKRPAVNTFVTVQDGHHQVIHLLPADSKCNICW